MQRKLNILVLHGVDNLCQVRNTTFRHMRALERYSSGNRFLYHYVADSVTDHLRRIPFDVIVFDATFLCWRWIQPAEAFQELKQRYAWIADRDCFKVAFPQDDYDHAFVLDDWLADYGVQLVYSICPKYREILYPRMSKEADIEFALTGYVDESDIELYFRHQRPFESREIDIGYRVRRLPVTFGRYGLLKSELGRHVSAAAAAAGGWVTDISDHPADVLFGENWPAFLGNCRFVLGSEGGSSVLDGRGDIRRRVQAYVRDNPDATEEELFKACIDADDEKYVFAMPGPRIFEIAMAHSCPVLVEGDYLGILVPEEHYIPIRRDLSGIPELLERLSDFGDALRVRDNFNTALIEDQRFRYSSWIADIMGRIEHALCGLQTGQLSDWQFNELCELHRDQMRRDSAVAVNLEITALKSEIADLYSEITRLRSVAPLRSAVPNRLERLVRTGFRKLGIKVDA